MRNNLMNILEIKLKNPIDFKEFNKIKTSLTKSSDFNFLIIDFDKHNFASIDVIKYFKEEFKKLELELRKFQKIAFIHPPEYSNKSNEPNFYELFTSKNDAIEWVLSHCKTNF